MLSSDVIHLDSLSTSICCQIHDTSFDALYSPVVGVNLMYKSFAHALFENISLTPITKLLKNPSWQILSSLGIVYVLPIMIKELMVELSFCVFDEFHLLIGQPLEKLIHEGQKGNLNINLGKNFSLSVSITYTPLKLFSLLPPDWFMCYDPNFEHK
jgi:hypothetical protein